MEVLQVSASFKTKWAAAWQNQQNLTSAPGEDSDQPIRSVWSQSSLCAHSMGSLGLKVSSCGQGKLRSVWADAQADLSESSLGAQVILLVLSCCGSNNIMDFSFFLSSMDFLFISLSWKQFLFITVCTVNFLNIRTLKQFVVITLKFELCGSTIE